MWFLWNFCTNNNWKKNLKILFHKCDQSAGKRINKFFLKLIETIICCTSNYPYHSHGWFLLFKVFPFEPHCNSTMMTQLWFSHSLTFFYPKCFKFSIPSKPPQGEYPNIFLQILHLWGRGEGVGTQTTGWDNKRILSYTFLHILQ